MDYNQKFQPMNPIPDTDPAGGATLTPEQLAPINTPVNGILNKQFGELKPEDVEGKDYGKILGAPFKPVEGYGPDWMKKPLFGLFGDG